MAKHLAIGSLKFIYIFDISDLTKIKLKKILNGHDTKCFQNKNKNSSSELISFKNNYLVSSIEDESYENECQSKTIDQNKTILWSLNDNKMKRLNQFVEQYSTRIAVFDSDHFVQAFTDGLHAFSHVKAYVSLYNTDGT